jgi:hypothetical protein
MELTGYARVAQLLLEGAARSERSGTAVSMLARRADAVRPFTDDQRDERLAA